MIRKSVYQLITIFFLLGIPVEAFSNMASPVTERTRSARPFINRHIAITSEDLKITPDAKFRSALYDITYHIDALEEGVDIPLLFIALKYASDFRETVDGKEVKMLKVPDEYETADSPGFKDFNYLFRRFGDEDEDKVTVNETSYGGRIFSFHDLHYFKTSLNKGKHVIQLHYKGYRWTNSWDWVNVYNFNYALSPANYWKSFGKLNVTIDARACPHRLVLKLGKKIGIAPHTIRKIETKGIPTEILDLTYTPEIKGVAKTLLDLGSVGLTAIFSLVLILIQVWGTLIYRRRLPDRKRPAIFAINGFVFSLFITIFFMYSYDIIDAYLAPHAGGNHGYIFFSIIFYPMIALVYWPISLFLDDLAKFIVRRKKSRLNA